MTTTKAPETCAGDKIGSNGHSTALRMNMAPGSSENGQDNVRQAEIFDGTSSGNRRGGISYSESTISLAALALHYYIYHSATAGPVSLTGSQKKKMADKKAGERYFITWAPKTTYGANIRAPATTAHKPVLPPAKIMIMDCTKAACVVTPIRFPMPDRHGMAHAMRRNCGWRLKRYGGGTGLSEREQTFSGFYAGKSHDLRVRSRTRVLRRHGRGQNLQY